jgi:hypothetical protein
MSSCALSSAANLYNTSKRSTMKKAFLRIQFPPLEEKKFIIIININLRCSKCREKTTDIVSSLTDAREHSSDLATYAVTFDLFFPASSQHNTCPGRAQFLIRGLLTTSNCHLIFLFQTRLRSIYKWKERIYNLQQEGARPQIAPRQLLMKRGTGEQTWDVE